MLLLQDAIEAARVIARVWVNEVQQVGRGCIRNQRSPIVEIGRRLQNVVAAGAAEELHLKHLVRKTYGREQQRLNEE